MRKIYAIALICFVFVSFMPKNVFAKDTPPTVSADSAVLIDAATGEILYSKNPTSAYPPASTTKIMTALLTLENSKLDDVVTVGKNPPLADGSKIYIFEGEQIKVKDLLYAVFLVSANDCAEALAEHIGGSLDNFAAMMNKRAKELGCTDTSFVNPTGLFDANHKTSSKDLALIMRELAKHPEFKEIATTLSYKIQPTNKCDKERPLFNENKLMQKNTKLYYEGIDGGKTGYTIQSDHSYVASATRNGQRLIVALVHDKNKTYFNDAVNLFNYGFNNYDLVKLFSKGDLVSTYTDNNLNIPLYASEDFYFVRDKGDVTTAALDIISKDLSNVVFKKGDKILDASFSLKNKNIGTLGLISGADHSVSAFNPKTSDKSNVPTAFVLITALISTIGIIMAIISIRLVKITKNKAKK